MARLEDNVLLLQLALQHSHHLRRPIHILFVDLAKAYDTIDHSLLWGVLLEQLQLPRDLVSQLQQLYKDTSVLLAGAEHLGSIPVTMGLKQGCPCSPLLFSLFFDRVEAAVKLAAGSCTPYSRHFLRYLALQLLILLFADDVVLLAWTLQALCAHDTVEGVVVPLSENDPDWPGWTDYEGRPLIACTGGSTRAASVLAGLQALPASVRADDFVLVHDAARPNLGREDLAQLLERGRNDPVGAILAAPVRDTLKRAGDDGGIDGTEPRERLWRAFTPQLFRRLQLTRALEAATAEGVEVTDEAMAMERLGLRPLLVEGAESNFKITTRADLDRFEFELSRRT